MEKSAAGGIFIFKYGKYVVDKYTPTELMREAHLLNSNVKERYAAELNGAFLMYRYFQNNPTEFNVSCGLSIQNISELFAAYLKNEGKSEATIDRYVKQVPNNSEVQNIVQSIAGTTALFDVMDVAKLLQISQKVAAQDFDKKGGNMYSAGINAFAHFVSNLNLFQRHIEKGYDNKQLVWQKHPVPLPLQTIFYGAPGTGKSYNVKSEKLAGVPEENIFRTTFHPDSDYASFVGCYKPKAKGFNVLAGENLTEEQLLQKFSDSANGNDKKAKYLYEALIRQADMRCLGIDGKSLASKLEDKGFSNCTYDGECAVMAKIYDFLVKDGYVCENKITYSFTPQVFTKAYIKAWEEMKQENPQPVYLVIEEINRGNCAQIFGDIFQLLDRNESGYSEYPIDIDEDLKNYLVQNLGADSEGIKDGKLCLPPNLNLLATMNTSDQSLFPMDSAFKRRWDWEFVPIRYEKTKKEKEKNDPKDNFDTFTITIDDKHHYLWTDFLKNVNAKILSVTDSEDKQMGEYFIRKSVDQKTFINKVMYYLWSEVGKDMYGSTNPFFVQKTKDENGQDVENQLSFNDLFKENATQLLQGFMEKLEVKSEEEKAAEKTATPPLATPAE